MRWYLATNSGDFRLLSSEGDDGKLLTDRCQLLVEDPTPREQDVLQAFIVEQRGLGHVGPEAAFSVVGESRIELGCSVAVAGRQLARDLNPPRGNLTAVRSKSGTMLAVVDAASMDEVITAIDEKERAEREAEEAKEAKQAEGRQIARREAAVVSARRPTLCCPNPRERALVRSSQVLREFCTPRQWSDWCRYGWLICRGGSTGEPYRVHHRHHPFAIDAGYVTWNLTWNHAVHCYDWGYQPAEEVMAIKLFLENAEAWIRNPSGWFGPGHRFPHPLGYGCSDGTWDTGFMSNLGGQIRGIGDALVGALEGS